MQARYNKILLRVILLTIVLGLAFGIYYANRETSLITAGIIKEMIYREAAGKFDLNEFDVELNLLMRTVRIEGLSVVSQQGSGGASFTLFLPAFEMQLISALDLYLHQELKIHSVELFEPNLHLTRIDTATRSDISFEAGNLYQQITRFLNVFQVDDFKLNDGHITYTQTIDGNERSITINHISFEIRDFLIESGDSTNRPLFTDNIELDISNQVFLLPDSIHQLTFDRLHLSTIDKEFEFENFRLMPLPHPAVRDSSQVNFFLLIIPELAIGGLDFVRAYQQNELQIQSIHIPRAVANLDIFDHKIRDAPKASNSINSLLKKLFRSFAVENLNLANTSLAITHEQDNKRSRINLDRIDVNIRDFSLDTGSMAITRDVNYISHIDLAIQNLHAAIQDSSLVTSLSRFELNTDAQSLVIDSLSLKPKKPLGPIQTLDLLVPQIRLAGAGILESWGSEKLSTDSLLIQHPRVTLKITPEKVVDNSASGDASLLRVFESVDLSLFSIEDGMFEIQSGKQTIVLEEADLVGFDLQYSGRSDSIDILGRIVREIFLETSKGEIRNDEMAVGFRDVRLTSATDRLEADQINFQLTDGTSRIDLFDFDVIGFDLDQLENHEAVIFDTLRINKVDLSFNQTSNRTEQTSSRKKLNTWINRSEFNLIQIHEIDLDIDKRGNPVADIQNVQLELGEFRYDSTLDIYYTAIDLKIDTIFVPLAQIDHSLAAANIVISENQSFASIGEIKISPNLSTLQNKINFHGNGVKFDGADIQQLINGGEVRFDRGVISNPSVEVIWHLEKNEGSVDDFREKMTFNELNINDISLDLKLIRGDDTVGIQTDSLSAVGYDFSKSTHVDDQLLYTREILIDGYNIVVDISEHEEHLSLDEIHIDSDDGNLRIGNLGFRKANAFDIWLNELDITGVDYDALRRSQGLDMSSLRLEGPDIMLMLPTGQTEADGPALIDLPDQIPLVRTGTLDLSSATFRLLRENLNQGDTLYIQDMSLHVDDLEITDQWQLADWDYKASNLRFELASFDLQLPDGHQQIHLDQLSYDINQELLQIDSLQVGHISTPEAFAAAIPYQKTWLDLHVDQTRLYGLDMVDALLHNQLYLDLIDIQNLQIEAERDKRLEFDPDQRKNLPTTDLFLIDVPILIDSIQVTASSIHYREIHPGAEAPGVIYFSDITGQLSNVTNLESRIQQDPFMSFHTSAKFMESGTLSNQVAFDLRDSGGGFFMQGELLGMELNELNQFMEPAVHVQISSGATESARWSYTATNEVALGSMDFYYRNLKLNVLTQAQGKEVKNKHFLSFFANTFVVNKRNPKMLSKKDGDIFFERDVRKDVFDYWANSLLSGMVSSIGAINNRKKIRQFNKKGSATPAGSQ